MTKVSTEAVTGAILAGGLSRRMGFNKAHIKVGSETILERNIKLFAEIFDSTMVVTSLDTPYTGLPARVVTDIHPGAGSLGGIYTALFHADGPVFVAACDMPGLDPGAIRATITASEIDTEFGACNPFIEGREHPMHALYRQSCLKPILKMIEGGRLRVSGLLKELHVLRLTDDNFKDIAIAASVANINTPEELKGIKGAKRPDG